MDNLLNYFLSENPLDSFNKWYEEAGNVEQNAQAMSVATIDYLRNRPVTRTILFKGMKDQKLTFYTNYLSPKAKDLEHNPEIALNFYWHISKRQVRIQGRVIKMSKDDSAQYFHSRDRVSQIESYASHQSEEIVYKAALLKKVEEVKAMFDGKPIPLPENWGGYLVEPYEFEFFVYGDNRINDRFLYELKNGKWEVRRLQP